VYLCIQLRPELINNKIGFRILKNADGTVRMIVANPNVNPSQPASQAASPPPPPKPLTPPPPPPPPAEEEPPLADEVQLEAAAEIKPKVPPKPAIAPKPSGLSPAHKPVSPLPTVITPAAPPPPPPPAEAAPKSAAAAVKKPVASPRRKETTPAANHPARCGFYLSHFAHCKTSTIFLYLGALQT
jgi:hypothetical protein